MLYSAFTHYLGFKVNSGEYKVMGLAPYGEPHYVDLILDKLVQLGQDGAFQLNMKYFSFPYSHVMTNRAFAKLFALPPRLPESPLTQAHFDIAASVQKVTEVIVSRMAQHLHMITGLKRLCIAGGVALNCVANGRLLQEGPFDDIWIQPAAGDAGGAVGVAYTIWHEVLGRRRPTHCPVGTDLMQGAYLGPAFTPDTIKATLDQRGIPYDELPHDMVAETTARLLAEGQVVGWFQGRMEFGPRALGARSILGDARSPSMQQTMNLKIKYRESFRPFAPSVLRERVSDVFELAGHPQSILGTPKTGYDSPYMLLVANVKADKCTPMTDEQQNLFGIDKLNVVRSSIPACTHVDYSARIQTVSRQTHPLYHEMIAAFDRLTGSPVIVNTSFNVRGEPIVCTPDDAINCFLGTEMDTLVMETLLVRKTAIPKSMCLDYKDQFQLD
jgi:carbamoyltransferase